MGAAVFFAGDGFGSQSFVEKKFSDATDAWDRSDRTLMMPAFAAFATRADGTIQQDHYVIATFVC